MSERISSIQTTEVEKEDPSELLSLPVPQPANILLSRRTHLPRVITALSTGALILTGTYLEGRSAIAAPLQTGEPLGSSAAPKAPSPTPVRLVSSPKPAEPAPAPRATAVPTPRRDVDVQATNIAFDARANQVRTEIAAYNNRESAAATATAIVNEAEGKASIERAKAEATAIIKDLTPQPTRTNKEWVDNASEKSRSIIEIGVGIGRTIITAALEIVGEILSAIWSGVKGLFKGIFGNVDWSDIVGYAAGAAVLLVAWRIIGGLALKGLGAVGGLLGRLAALPVLGLATRGIVVAGKFLWRLIKLR